MAAVTRFAAPPAPQASAEITKEYRDNTGTFSITTTPRGVTVTGKLSGGALPDERVVTYAAAAPVEGRASFSGSGLPFATKEQAFENSPNQGVANVNADGSFRVELRTPSSYYVGLGTVLVPPTLFLSFLVKSKQVLTHIPLGPPIAFRFNTYPMQYTAARTSPTFYSVGAEVPARSQEQILRASAYPADNTMPANFWGTRPPR